MSEKLWTREADPHPLSQYKSVKATPKPEFDKSDPDLILACRLWDKITEKMNKREFEMPDELEHAGTNAPYSSGDFRPLQCTIIGKKAELTVGSASGHRVHVDLDKKILEYYDNDVHPNEVMKDLLEEAGAKCQLDGEGVKCTGVTKDNIQPIFKVLAMPTSMDFRLQECITSKRPDPTEQCEEDCENNTENPSNCNCDEVINDCVSSCVSDYDYEYSDEEASEECKELEKKFFHEGAKKIELTKAENRILSKSQKKISGF